MNPAALRALDDGKTGKQLEVNKKITYAVK
jgi:hypothetical protein